MLAKIKISDYMNKNITTLTKETDVFIAIQQLLDHKQTSAPVVDESGKFIGIFSEKDCIEAVLEASYNQGVSGKVADFMTDETLSVDAETNILDIAKKFKTCSERVLPVMNDNKIVGLVSGEDLLKALISIR
jgi:CBS domain-containing protein